MADVPPIIYEEFSRRLHRAGLVDLASGDSELSYGVARRVLATHCSVKRTHQVRVLRELERYGLISIVHAKLIKIPKKE